MRYVAIYGHQDRDVVQSWVRNICTNLGLESQMNEPNFYLFGDFPAPIRLEPSAGFIVGTLFETPPSGRRLEALNMDDSKKVLASGGKFLIENYWGGYVAFLYGDDGVHVVRDPSAMAPCYYFEVDGLTIVASHIDLIYQVTSAKRAFDWSSIALHLLADQFRPAQTCLSGITELLGGLRLTLKPTSTTLMQIWSPWTYANARTEKPEERQTNKLREVVRLCVTAWASPFKKVVLGVSGGLDSSIIAACLAQSAVPQACLTLVTKDFRGDERGFARLLTQSLGQTLNDILEDPHTIDIARSDAAHLPRPIARSFAQSGNAANVRLANATGADAFISGGGGDNVFCYMQSGNPIADRLLSEGFGSGALETAIDMARLSGCSLWTALSKGVRNAYFRAHSFRWPINTTFLTANALARARPLQHPWLKAPKGSLPGKAAHIAWLMHIQNHLEGLQRETLYTTLWPLMSQPVVELCLSIPTWAWCKGGQNRVPAREAFRDLLPAEIIDRRSKGTPDTYMTEIFDLNRKAIWDLLSTGRLAHQGFLDLPAIRSVLNENAPTIGQTYARILMLADVEAWLQSQNRLQAICQAPPT